MTESGAQAMAAWPLHQTVLAVRVVLRASSFAGQNVLGPALTPVRRATRTAAAGAAMRLLWISLQVFLQPWTGGVVMVCAVAAQKGGVGKTTSAINVAVLCARRGERTLVVDSDPQSTLTRQLGLDAPGFAVSLVDVLAGRAVARDAIVAGVHGVDVIPAARELAGVEMSLVGELGRERFLHDALAPVLGGYDVVVIDTPPNLGLLTVNALVCADIVLAPVSADIVLAPVSAEDEASVHGILELRATIAKLAQRLGGPASDLFAVLTRWHPQRISSRSIEAALAGAGLAPAARIRLRSAAVAHAACVRVPLALGAPDSPVALAYERLVEQLIKVTV